MTILENPAPTSSFRNWQNVATGYGAFCVQERTASARRPSILHFNAPEKPFRIIFSHCPVDFLSLNEKLIAKNGTGVPTSTSEGNKRFVVAVASTLANILEDWGMVMKGWQTLSQREDSAIKRRAKTRRTAPTTDALTAEEWREVVEIIKEQISKDTEEVGEEFISAPVQESEEEGGEVSLGASTIGAPNTASASPPVTPSQHRIEKDVTPIDDSDFTPEPSSLISKDEDTFLSALDQEESPATPTYYYTSDLFDIVLLRHIDVWAWSSPHVTMLMIFLCFFAPWHITLAILVAEALPLSLLQRRRAVDQRTKKRDQWHLERFSKLFSKLVHTNGEEGEKKKTKNPFKLLSGSEGGQKEDDEDESDATTTAVAEVTLAERLSSFAETPYAKIVVVGFVVCAVLLLITPASIDLSSLLDWCIGKLMGLALLLTGLRQVLKPPAVNRRPLSRKAIANLLQSNQRNIHPHVDDPSYRYVRPPLSETDKVVVDQLSNFGAPYPLVLLRPLRELSVTTGWSTVGMGDKIHCEHRYSNHNTVHTIRYTVNLPLTNVGTLQAVLLDDFDGKFDCTHSTNVYSWDTHLMSREILRQLDYNLNVVRSVVRSPMWGVTPVHIDQFCIPAILLNHEQQKALNITGITPHPPAPEGRPKARAHQRAFLQCAIPCPETFASGCESPSEGETRSGTARTSPTSKEQPLRVEATSLILGLEEADGSLTLCLLNSFSGLTPGKFFEEQRLIVGSTKTQLLAALLEATGSQPNQIDDFSNAPGFQPFYCRQAFTDLPAEAADFPTAEEDNNPSFTVIQSRNSTSVDRTPLIGLTPGEGERTEGIKRHRSLRFMSTAPLPPVCHQVLLDSLQPNLWRLRKENSSGVQVFQRTTPIKGKWDANCSVNVFRSEVVISSSFLNAVRILSREDSFAVYNGAVEAHVSLGALIPVAELLATVEEDNSDEEYTTLTGETPVNASPPVSSVLKRVGEERAEGCLVYHTAFRGEYGLVARDAITRDYGPFFLTARNMKDHLFPASESQGLTTLRQLPDDTKLWIHAGEDPVEAGDTQWRKKQEIIPPLMDYERTHITLWGTLCYELGGGQVKVVEYRAVEPSGWLPRLYLDYVLCEQMAACGGRLKTLVEYANKSA